MTVSTSIIKRIYQGNGETRLWDVDFPLFSREDLQVWITSPQGEQEQIYDFTLNAALTSVEYPLAESEKAALPLNWQITLLRKTPITQEMNLIRHGELDAELLETGYDKLTFISQELAGKQLQQDADISAQAQALSQETHTREQADELLQEKLDTHIAAYTQADASLQNQLLAETSARSQKDLQLQQNLQTEVSARLAAEQVFQQSLDAKQPVGDYVTATQLSTGLSGKQDQLTLAQQAAINSGVTLSTVSQVSFNSSRLTAFAPYIQSAAVRDMNEQEVVNTTDLLSATGDLHALNLDLSQNTVLKKLTAAGTSGSLANLSGVLVSKSAPFDHSLSPQLDVSYSTLNRAALVNLFHSMPYNVGYNVIGNPTIVDGIVTDFTRTSYLRTNLQFDFSQTDYEFVIRATPHAVSTRNAAIVGTQPAGLRIYFMQDKIECIPATGGATPLAVRGTFDVSSFYYVRLMRKGNVYTLDYSSDGINYTGTVSVTNQQHLSSNLFLQFGYYGGDGWDPLDGSIDIAHSYIKGNGAIWFRGTATMSKTCDVRGCSGTADLTAEDKAIVTDKGWSLTVA